MHFFRQSVAFKFAVQGKPPLPPSYATDYGDTRMANLLVELAELWNMLML